MNSHFTIIVAIDACNGIGIGNALPWHLPEDLAHFKRITLGHPIVMGRKTFESIGRPLPGRRNIVITRNPSWQHDGIETVPSLTAAATLTGDTETFIIGGAEIYAASLPQTQRLIVTEINSNFACDAFFPTRDPKQWQEISRQPHYSAVNDFNYAFVIYERRTSSYSSTSYQT